MKAKHRLTQDRGGCPPRPHPSNSRPAPADVQACAARGRGQLLSRRVWLIGRACRQARAADDRLMHLGPAARRNTRVRAGDAGFSGSGASRWPRAPICCRSGAYKSQGQKCRCRLEKLQGQACRAGWRAIIPMSSRPIWATKAPEHRLRVAGFRQQGCRFGALRPAKGRWRRHAFWANTFARTFSKADIMRSRAIYGCAGTDVFPAPGAFSSRGSALGLHPVRPQYRQGPAQVRATDIAALRRNRRRRSHAPILIDQEGGRVARLVSRRWHERAAGGRTSAVYAENPEAAREATYLNARLIAHDLAGLGDQYRTRLPVLGMCRSRKAPMTLSATAPLPPTRRR